MPKQKENPTTRNKKLTLKFSEIHKKDIPIAGGKGANLGEIYNAKIPVPNGFVVTSTAYYKFMKEKNLYAKVISELKSLDVENSKKLQKAADDIQKAIMSAKISDKTKLEIKNAYHNLSGNIDKPVAVRSSATAEDLPDASFAGQQDTYLNVKGWNNVIKATKKCWASLFGARAIYYRQKQGFDHFKVGIAVPVQLMIQSEVSGIMFTVNPLTNDKTQISIESAYGLGQPIVSGEITPDQYLVSKEGFKILKKTIVKQTWQFTKVGNIKISKAYQKKQKLSDINIRKLAQIGQQLENHYHKPQDIEWGYYKKHLYIVQTRPITTIKKETKKKLTVANAKIPAGDIILKGQPASPGYVSGRVRIIHTAKEIRKVKQGDILVTEMTNPDFVPAMRKATAILTDNGGVTSHAAIVSRELGVPAIVGSELATKTLQDGELITINGYNGEVYAGDYVEILKASEKEKDYSEFRNAKTATKVYVNLGEVELAPKVGQMGVDGIGLLRAEFMMAEIGEHPRAIIAKHKEAKFIEKLANSLAVFTESFGERPVIYRTTDFKTNEYRSLKGGEKYEAIENNPLIGWRGVSRYLDNADVFKMELSAIRYVRNELGFKNLHLMLPFVRTVEELKDAKKLIVEAGLRRTSNFQLFMMVEVPSTVILLEDFIKVGIDGVSIGSNDLTMLILGVDRDNPKVAKVYNELNPAVLWALERIITTCKKHNIKASICGQAPTTYPNLTKKLVEWGVTSVSVSPDVAYLTRKIVQEAEYKIAAQK